MAKVKITETVLRDAHQSLLATRMKTEDMLPVLEKLDNVGYYSLEAWGGATFDACLRFLNEDPWERLRKIKSIVKKTPLQMLLMGQHLVGYKPYADDVVEYFVQKAICNGVDIIRIFDALNDLRNVEAAIKACKKEGGHAQGTVCYTQSPVHTLEGFVKDACQLVEMGADSICIKDMAGILTPFTAYDLVKAMKESVDVPVHLHTHYTGGLASMACLKAVEAGVDGIDCAISPMALGTSQPPTESMIAALSNTPYDTGITMNSLKEVSSYFGEIKDKYIKSGVLDPKAFGMDSHALNYQVPGGMLSNLLVQLKQVGKTDKLEEALKEIPRVREDFGFPPLATPVSQIIGIQAVMNVIATERYKIVPKESKALIKGEYGKTPAPVSPQVQRIILGNEEPVTCRPADLIEGQLEKTRVLMKEYMEQDEDVLTYTLFPETADSFFKMRQAQKYKIDSNLVDYTERVHPI